jgi:hypothetical protein
MATAARLAPQTPTERARMKFSSVLLIFASVLVVGCAGTSPLSPDAASVSSGRSLASATPASAAQAFFPPIEPSGISCPSDAPQIRVSSFGARLDIEFSEVIGAYKYEVEIVTTDGEKGEKYGLEVQAPAHRVEWYGHPGLYRVRVRTMNCGGFGSWSAEFLHSLDDYTPLPPRQPPSEPVPQCMESGCQPPPESEPPPVQCMMSGCD